MRAFARQAVLPLAAVPVALLIVAFASARERQASTADSRGAGSASTGSASATGISPKMVVSPNWAGYVATAPKEDVSYGHPYFTAVSGTWTVPAARCGHPKAKSYSTVWVGLGGYASRNQEEVGTDSNCTATGKPFYYAWFELVPYLSYKTFPNIESKVYAGDTLTGLVKVLTPTLVLLQLRDRTQHWTFSKKITFSSQDTTTADWVAEAPAECIKLTCAQASLANFGTVRIRNISAVARGSSGNLRNPRWKVIPVKLVPGELLVPRLSTTATAVGPGGKKGRAKSPAGATPGPVSRDGSSFSLKWHQVAGRGV